MLETRVGDRNLTVTQFRWKNVDSFGRSRCLFFDLINSPKGCSIAGPMLLLPGPPLQFDALIWLKCGVEAILIDRFPSRSLCRGHFTGIFRLQVS